LYGDYESGNVGVPFPCNEIKLVDVPGKLLFVLYSFYISN